MSLSPTIPPYTRPVRALRSQAHIEARRARQAAAAYQFMRWAFNEPADPAAALLVVPVPVKR